MITKRLWPVSLVAFALLAAGCKGSIEKKLREAREQDAQARSLFERKRYLEAERAVQVAMNLNGELQQDSALAEDYLLLGQLQRQTGRYDSALITLRYVLQRAHLMSNPTIEREGKLALADFLLDMQSYSDAASLGADASTLGQFSSDWGLMFQALDLGSKAYQVSGNYPAELKILKQLARLDSERFGNEHAVELRERQMKAYFDASSFDSTRAVYEEWLADIRSGKDVSSAARAYILWGVFQRERGEYDSSSHSLSRALDMLNSHPDKLLQGRVFFDLGNLAFRQGSFENAKRYFSNALDLIREQEDRPLELLVDVELAACDLNLRSSGDEEALDELQQRCEKNRDSCHEIGFREGEAFELFVLGKIVEQRNEPATAMRFYEQALECYEQNLFQHGWVDRDGEAEIVEAIETCMGVGQTGWYDAPLQLQCSVEDPVKSFELIERKNLHDLVQFYSQLDIKTSNSTLNQKIADVQWKRSAVSLIEHDIVQELSSGSSQNLERLRILRELYPSKTRELSEAENDLAAVNPNFQKLLVIKPLSLKEIQERIPANAVLLEFVPSVSALYCVVVKKDTSVMHAVSVNRKYLLSLINEYNSLVADVRPNSNDVSQGADVSAVDRSAATNRIAKLSQMLYTLLIAPLQSLMKNASQVYIVAPHEFGFLPFHTLRTFENGKTMSLIQKFKVSYLPSAAVLLFPTISQKAVDNVVGFGCAGNTSWDVEYELEDIRAFYDKAKMLFDTSATLDQIRNVQYDLLHISADFELDTAKPNGSHIVVSDGVTAQGLREVSLGTMFAIPVPPTLVFSNISPTAGGLFRYAPYLMLANGSQTVIATMWQGDRKAKKYFGEIFYTNLQLGSSLGAAYYQAMLALNNNAEFSQPNRWGLYYLFGK